MYMYVQYTMYVYVEFFFFQHCLEIEYLFLEMHIHVRFTCTVYFIFLNFLLCFTCENLQYFVSYNSFSRFCH